MPDLEQILKLSRDRTKLIDDIIAKMETRVSAAQGDLLRRVIEDFVDKMDVDEAGKIKNTLANKRKLSTLDRVYTQFVQQTGIKIAQTVVEGVSNIMDFNGKYYGALTQSAKLGNVITETRGFMEDWLGITKRGGLVENGYLNRLVRDESVRNTIRDSVFKSVVSQKGFFEVKKDLRIYIEGEPKAGGALQKYYRNFVYDTFSQVDRAQAQNFADNLGFNHAIYEGGLIKTSRDFCRKRNGKLFTRDEIARFNPTVARPPNYNPFTDLGGYGCRHHLNWVPDAVAFAMRPELRKAA